MLDQLSLLSLASGGWGQALLAGALVTVSLALACLPIGLPLGLGVALAARSKKRFPRAWATVFSTVFRGLPELLTLSIPVFENEAPRELTARLSYRIKEGRLSIWFELVRPHKLVEAAFRDTWARIAEETGVLLLLGSPE